MEYAHDRVQAMNTIKPKGGTQMDEIMITGTVVEVRWELRDGRWIKVVVVK